MAQYNLSLIADSVPTKVFTECGLDFDRWFPPHRRLAATAGSCSRTAANASASARTLDTVRERFDVRCGPLT